MARVPKQAWIVVVGLLVLAAVLYLQLPSERVHDAPLPPPTSDARLPSIDVAIERGADYLERFNEGGRFVYRQHVDGHEMPRKYNALRHAGSIYALADFHGSASEPRRARTKAVIAAATRYLVTSYVRPMRRDAAISAVWSNPSEEGSSTGHSQAKLGGAALAVIAILSARAIDESITPLETAQALGRFILFMQQENGDFRAKYEEEGGFSVDFDSLYYPGEAILALVRLYEADRDRRWLEAAARGAAHLVESRAGDRDLPNDHWLMIAIDRLLPHYGDLAEPPIGRDALLAHAIALGRAMLDEQTDVDDRVDDEALAGSFMRDGRSTPSATRLEGLLALEHTLAAEPGNDAFRASLRRGIARGIGFLRRCQVQDGPLAGGFTEALSGTRESAGEVRIDYVQHAMSALLGYARMCERGGCE